MGDNIGREAWWEAPGPRGVTFCHTCEMALTFLPKAGVRLGMAEGMEGNAALGLAARTGPKEGSNGFCEVGRHWF